MPADAAGLDYLPPDLRGLGIGVKIPAQTDLSSLVRLRKLDRLSLSHHRRLPSVLSELPSLRTLYLEGPLADVAALADLVGLRHLTLRSATVDLEPVSRLPALRSLALKLGGGSTFDVLSRLVNLEYLELWRVRGLADLSFVGSLTNLRELFLQSLSKVTMLPEFRGHHALTKVALESMKGLVGLGALATAPNLKQLYLIDAPHLLPEDLTPLKGARQLEVHIGLGSDRKNRAARDILQLTGTYGHLKFPVPPDGDVEIRELWKRLGS